MCLFFFSFFFLYTWLFEIFFICKFYIDLWTCYFPLVVVNEFLYRPYDVSYNLFHWKYFFPWKLCIACFCYWYLYISTIFFTFVIVTTHFNRLKIFKILPKDQDTFLKPISKLTLDYILCRLNEGNVFWIKTTVNQGQYPFIFVKNT